MSDDAFAADVTALAALGEPVRRALYGYVVAQDASVGREAAAAGVGVPTHVAKFHLDKLLDAGLLEVEYRRPPGRGGPGAGRPTKLYRRAGRDVAVSLPARRYDLAGRVLAEAIAAARRDGTAVGDALATTAREVGRRLVGHADVDAAVPDQEAVARVLARHGYEPRAADGEVLLTSCPFERLAADLPDVVCVMNRDLVDGVLDAVCPGALEARLDPGAGRCCVVVGQP
ncbi:transcriptional regulator [Cellulomonas algicola]|uniref:Transcriptional regulator n=1 Tax=Cellulomonas algicola TaxID=2071633 RepID=A0A401V451_9CELL|nr:helix-turn-helix domain-containing protein [Cellulomonas algicola]GCD21710.1 transcriptional regulator [Cellulomonas algicola]